MEHMFQEIFFFTKSINFNFIMYLSLYLTNFVNILKTICRTDLLFSYFLYHRSWRL